MRGIASTDVRSEKAQLRNRDAQPGQDEEGCNDHNEKSRASGKPRHRSEEQRDCCGDVKSGHGWMKDSAFAPRRPSVYNSTPRRPARTRSTAIENPNAGAECCCTRWAR